MTQASTVSARPERHDSARVDTTGRDHIIELLRHFDRNAFRDELRGPLFLELARTDMDTHPPAIADPGETLLLPTGSYRRNALAPHRRLHTRTQLTAAHFTRWLALWQTTVDDRYAGPRAELAKLQGSGMDAAMRRRITGTAHLGHHAGGPRAAVAAERSLRSWAGAHTPPEPR